MSQVSQVFEQRQLLPRCLFLMVTMVIVLGCRPQEPAPEGFTTQPNSDANSFTQLSPEHSGINFVIEWDKPAKYDRIFYSQNTGGGVCVGDIDQDGLPDIYLTRPSKGNRLYRNLGNCRFEDITSQAGIEDADFWGTGASFVDINNDGLLDIYACGYGMPNRLYINQGNTRFREMAKLYGLDYNGASVMMAFSDYDCDGDLDGYLVTAGLPPGPDQKFRVKFVGNKPYVLDELREFWELLYLPGDRAKQIEAGQYDHLFRNDGPDGAGNYRFTDVSRESGIDGTDLGQAATWWDYNNDGLPDLYVANDYWGSDKLYQNNGDGSFTDLAKTALPHTPWSSMGVDIADVNNDGHMDLLATDMAGSNHFKQKVGMGDMNSAGWFLEYAEPRQYSRNTLFVNSGTDRFMEAAYLAGIASSDWTWTPRFDDFDNDGRVDLFITNGMTREFTNSDLNDKAKSQFKEGSPEFFHFWRQQDFRRDNNLIYQNLGDLRFKDVSQDWGFDRLGVSFGAATGDFDQDGDLDIVVNNMDTTAFIYRNDLPVGNHLRVKLIGNASNRSGHGAIVRVAVGSEQQTRYLTPARGWTSTSEPILHFGLGDHALADRVTVHWPSGIVQELEAVQANKTLEIIEAAVSSTTSTNSSSPAQQFQAASAFSELDLHHQERPYDDFKLQPLLPNKLSQLGPGIACSDINGDGRDDFYLGGAAFSAGQILMSSEAGYQVKTSAAIQADEDHEDMGALFLDADADGDQDLYVVSGGVEYSSGSRMLRDRLYLNDGKGEFTRSTSALPDIRSSGSVVAAADFDRDGHLDLFIGCRVKPAEYPLAGPSTLLHHRDGQFEEVTDDWVTAIKELGMVTGATWTDLDDDGWLDLVVTSEWGPIRVFRNQQGTLQDATETAGVSELRGWWNGVSAGDIDNDGDQDLVVTNFGLNTKYHASAEHPARIYYGDFEGLGLNHIIESEYEGEKLFPVRGKSCSTNAMPFLSKKFQTYSEFGMAELDEIYTDESLEKSYRVEANTLETGVLINNGKGHFEFRPLPRLAQIAPCFGSAFEDVDADGNLDLILIQNFYPAQRETGHMDGGVSLLLLGDGQGGFAPIWPSQSGLVVPGDGTSVARADLNGDGRKDFLVGVNNGPWQAFEDSGPSSNQYYLIRLRGGPGNLECVGAKLRMHFSDGNQMTREIRAGEGYLSQHSASVSFPMMPANPAAHLEIRWPDGTMSEHPISGSSNVEIFQAQ